MKTVAILAGIAVLSLPVVPAAAADGSDAAQDKLDPKDPNYIRCRRIPITGSLVKKERICKTNAEWARANDDAQRNANDLITRNRTGTNCGPAGC